MSRFETIVLSDLSVPKKGENLTKPNIQKIIKPYKT